VRGYCPTRHVKVNRGCREICRNLFSRDATWAGPHAECVAIRLQKHAILKIGNAPKIYLEVISNSQKERGFYARVTHTARHRSCGVGVELGVAPPRRFRLRVGALRAGGALRQGERGRSRRNERNPEGSESLMSLAVARRVAGRSSSYRGIHAPRQSARPRESSSRFRRRHGRWGRFFHQ
jgi:hypothetical protein